MLSYYDQKKIYIPKFIHYKEDQFPGFPFVKHIQAGLETASILQGDGHYFMCIRSDGMVASTEQYNEPLGFRRKTLEELEALAASFINTPDRPVVSKANLHGKCTLVWKNGIKPRFLSFRNVLSGEEVPYYSLAKNAKLFGMPKATFRDHIIKGYEYVNGWQVVFPSASKAY